MHPKHILLRMLVIKVLVNSNVPITGFRLFQNLG